MKEFAAAWMDEVRHSAVGRWQRRGRRGKRMSSTGAMHVRLIDLRHCVTVEGHVEVVRFLIETGPT